MKCWIHGGNLTAHMFPNIMTVPQYGPFSLGRLKDPRSSFGFASCVCAS